MKTEYRPIYPDPPEDQKGSSESPTADCSAWIMIADKLPEEGQIVILEDPDRGTRFGCRHVDYEDWLWSIATEPPYIGHDGLWEADCSIEDGADFQPVMWHALPSLPNDSAQGLRGSTPTTKRHE